MLKRKNKNNEESSTLLLKSLHDNARGIIFVNNTGKTLSIKLETLGDKPFSEYFKLMPEGGRLPFFTDTHLRVSLSPENEIDLVMDKPLYEYTITIDLDLTMNVKTEDLSA